MSRKKYTSKYPTVVTDQNINSANGSMIKKITVEEYYDLKHHTHSMSDIAVDEGSMTFEEMQSTINQMSQTINGLTTTINTLQEENSALREAINTINKEMVNMATVSDWDVEKPGNQDIKGNDLGTLMGFRMTEIV